MILASRHHASPAWVAAQPRAMDARRHLPAAPAPVASTHIQRDTPSARSTEHQPYAISGRGEDAWYVPPWRQLEAP